jgi:hypothetical protein
MPPISTSASRFGRDGLLADDDDEEEEDEDEEERERVGRRGMRWEAVGQRGGLDEEKVLGVDVEERAPRLGLGKLLREE